MNTLIFLKDLASTHFCNILSQNFCRTYPCCRILNKPWVILEHVFMPAGIILAGPISIGFGLYELNVSFRAQTFS